MTGMKRSIRNCAFIVFVLALIYIWCIPFGFAEDNHTAIKQVKPVPHYIDRPIDYGQFVKSHFDSWGKFNKAYEGHIQYGDKIRKLAPGVNVPDIEVGTCIGVMYDETRLVTEIHKLQRCP
jgi:hypothetical protein